MGKYLFGILAAFIVFAQASPKVLACICVTPNKELSAKEHRRLITHEYGQAAAVFSGEVTELTPSSVKLQVRRRWKGTTADEMTMPHGGSSCDFYFELGREYVVYAYGSNNGMRTNVCSPTKAMGDAAKDIKVLEKLKRRSVKPAAKSNNGMHPTRDTHLPM